jgi:hypothetical protein
VKEFGDRGGRHPGADRSLHSPDPEGNLVEVWDFVENGDGADDGVDALR